MEHITDLLLSTTGTGEKGTAANSNPTNGTRSHSAFRNSSTSSLI
jgi:hypothetical protein